MSEPQFKHYCDKCEYLGSTPDADFYVCRQGERPGAYGTGTLLIRVSDEDSDYRSFPVGYVPNYGPNPSHPEYAAYSTAEMALANAMLVAYDAKKGLPHATSVSSPS